MDGLKLPLKEDIIPRGVDKVLFVIAPAIALIPAFISFAIIPVGPIVSIFHHKTPLQLTDLPVAVLLVLAMSSMARVRDRAGRAGRRHRRTRCSAACGRPPR